MIEAKIVADSKSPSGIRLTTFEFTYPRFIHSELMTHRAFSRNAASSRAIPVKKTLQRIWSNPAAPVHWGTNQAGMQASAELHGWRRWLAMKIWKLSSVSDVIFAWLLMKVGLHKQVANRVLEPAMHITTIVTSDQFGLANFFHQRNHKDAQPEFAALAHKAWILYNTNEPELLKVGEWHLPYITNADRIEVKYYRGLKEEERIPALKAISVGRCARVSYLNHNGIRRLQDDIDLHDKLKGSNPGHWSPFEHVAQATFLPQASGNFRGWKQYRKEFPQEYLNDLPVWCPDV